ncbi:hypothetical protein PIB30_049718 [Stylosanthes scabra]|uniref:Uncharacterized protein n=1 Tax=Stylosanthes scabra TaxID=79078 RepID=A0ABU6RHK5_9FABA|nr:hypothetical protein [Stylosanthes scabra]
MKKSSIIRGCISCILPCGALDVIRIVHSNGRVEEITTPTLKAADVMRAHPKHVIKKPSSPNVLVVPPHADLRRGNIYFLVPLPPPAPNNKNKTIRNIHNNKQHAASSGGDGYLNDIILSQNKHRRSRDTRARPRLTTLWRPHLDTISESPPSSSHHL